MELPNAQCSAWQQTILQSAQYAQAQCKANKAFLAKWLLMNYEDGSMPIDAL